LPRAMRGRLRHGRPYELRGRNATLHLRPGSTPTYRRDDGELILEITQELATEVEAMLRSALAGRFRFTAWPALEIVVTPSFIRSQEGKAVEVRGVAEPAEAERMIAAENARLAAGDDEAPDEEAEDDDEGDDEDEDAENAEAAPDLSRVRAALAMTERALKLAPRDGDVQFTHAMLLLDAGRGDDVIAVLPEFETSVRLNIAIRLAQRSHPRFADAVDCALAVPLPDKMFGGSTTSVGSGASMSSFGDVAHEVFGQLADAIVKLAPDKLLKLMLSLPDDADLLADTAHKALEAGQKDVAFTAYERLLALPIPESADDRTGFLQALNKACVQAHAGKAYKIAARIADRAQPVARENPYIFHSAACAYAALGDYAKAFEQVKLAVATGYDHIGKVEVDTDLGPLLEWPEFKALFRDWHARQEGN